MSSPAPVPPDKGLPPVAPPSGKHIAQLFLVPGLIVGVVVGLVMLGMWLWKGSNDPLDYLKPLESDNPDIRWRGANDLAQKLKRDDALASNPVLGLRLTELLQMRLGEYVRERESYLSRVSSLSEEQRRQEKKALQDRREALQFLSQCVGSLLIPVGAPLLSEMARGEQRSDEKTLAALRRWGLWSLANLGECSKRFLKLPPAQQSAVLAELRTQANVATGDRQRWAEQAIPFLESLQKGEAPNSLGVIDALVLCSRADDPIIRRFTAVAFRYWDGDKAEQPAAEQALVQLAADGGQGKVIEIDDDDSK